jgi:predicted PurR-regulated permease PerM
MSPGTNAADSERPSAPAVWWLAGAAGAAGLLWLFRGLLLPLLLAALGAYFAQPLVARCEERGVRRSVAVAALFVVATLALAALTVALAPVVRRQFSGLVEQLPIFAERLESVSATAHRTVGERLPALADQLPAPAPGWPERLLADQKRHAAALASGAGAVLFVLLLAPVFGFFLLRDGGRLLDGLVRVLPPRHIETTVAIWCEIDRIIGRYLRGLVLESLGVAGLVTLGLALLGVPAPLVLGAFAGLVNPLPYVGVLLSLAVALVVALGAGMGPQLLLAVVALFVAVRLVDDFVLVPLALGGSVHLHPALVIAAILAGEQTLGVLGMVLAVPLVTVIKEVARLLLESARRGPGRVAVRRVVGSLPTYVC